MRLIGALFLLTLAACDQQQLPKPEVLRIAVAANFAPTLKALVAGYNADRDSPVDVQVMVGSTGLLTAQLLSGAPYDMLFAADAQRPAALEEAGKTLGPPQTYAYGRLVLWGPDHQYKDARKRLLEGEFKHLAIGNPELAPYGAATRQVLQQLGLWSSIQNKLVRGENVGQAYRYVITERVDLGFVALSQVIDQTRVAAEEALWVVPANLHDSIEQQVVVLAGDQSEMATAFLEFCLSEAGRLIIQQAGYDLPLID
ncbi:MAG: molybdate ABC transporter substrate-binding protein [Nevskiales bacterium]